MTNWPVIFLALRNSNDQESGWTQLLVFIAVAVVWILGALARAKAQKDYGKEQQEQELPGPRPKPRYKPLGQPAPSEESLPERPKPIEPARYGRVAPQPSQLQRYPLKAEPAYQPVAELRPSAPLPQRKVRPVAKKTTRRLIKEPQKRQRLAPPKVEKVKKREKTPKPPETLFDYGDLGELETAILYYEILGRPVSLREPWEGLV